jgi:hypothetical protein
MVSLSVVSRLVQYLGHAARVIALVNSGTPLKFVMTLDIAIERISRVLVEQDHVTRGKIHDVLHRDGRGSQPDRNRKRTVL